jgi:tRNA threonylcarbamoyladenosine biosynthesis protein TsaE
MNEWCFHSHSPEETDRLAAALAPLLPERSTIALRGNLGAGKTRFVQGLAAALGVPREFVVSPTFVLCQIYYGQRTLHHYDLYRLEREQEFWKLGPEEAFAEPGLVVIEWADKFPNCLPGEYLEIEIHSAAEPDQSNSREFYLRGHGSPFETVVARLQAWI